MFGLGISEIVFIILGIIILVKPEDLPKLIRGTARIYSSLMLMARQFIREINLMD